MNPEIRSLTAAGSWTPELLEREHEIAELAGLLDQARAESGAIVCIEGAAGLGKTRLLERLRTRAARAGVRVLSARATELETAFPFGVARQLFDPFPAPREMGDADISFASLYALYSLTASLTEDGPLLISVDDAHWADAPSLEYLRFLSARLDGLPVLVTVASRPVADAGGSLMRLAADAQLIKPGALAPESTAKLLTAGLGSVPDDELVSVCQDLTGGNPFLLVELTRTLAREGIPPAEGVRALVPDTVARAVLLRLAQLPDGAQELARAVAVLGDGCELRHAAALASTTTEAAMDAADALRRAEILEAEPPLRFVHPLVAGAVYAELPAGARSREHARAAELLSAEAAPLERVAVHLLATEPGGDAGVAATLAEAARMALDQGAPQPALAYLRRAVREPPPPERRADLLELMNVAGVRAADASAFLEFETPLMDELTSEPSRLMRCGEGLAMGLIGNGRVAEAAELLHRTIEVADAAGDLALAVNLDAQLISFKQLTPQESRARFERYDGRLAAGSAEERIVLALNAWWSSLLGGTAQEASALARRAVSGAEAFHALLNSLPAAQAVLVLARADELDAASEAADRMIAAATQRGTVGSLAGAWYLRGYAAHRRGDLQSAETDARQGVQAARLRGLQHVFPLWTALLAEVLTDRGELEAADAELAASGLAGEIPDGYWFGPVLLSRGRLRLAQGRPREAADDLLELRGRMERWGFEGNPGSPAAGHAARALAALGERDRAVSLADEELGHARRWGAASVVGEALIAVGVASGDLAALEEAAGVLDGSPAQLVHASALTELGSALRRGRRAVEAREALRSGLALARSCGAVTLARRAADELEASGERAPRHTPIGAASLTPSERRVAEMAARGMTNREIAGALYVTIKTVESHMRAAFDKLGVRSRRDLGGALNDPSDE